MGSPKQMRARVSFVGALMVVLPFPALAASGDEGLPEFPIEESFARSLGDPSAIQVIELWVSDGGEGRWVDRNAFLQAGAARPGVKVQLHDFFYLDPAWAVNVFLTPPPDEDFPPGGPFGIYEAATQPCHWEIPDPVGSITECGAAWNMRGLWGVRIEFSSSQLGAGAFSVWADSCRHLDDCAPGQNNRD